MSNIPVENVVVFSAFRGGRLAEDNLFNACFKVDLENFFTLKSS